MGWLDTLKTVMLAPQAASSWAAMKAAEQIKSWPKGQWYEQAADRARRDASAQSWPTRVPTDPTSEDEWVVSPRNLPPVADPPSREYGAIPSPPAAQAAPRMEIPAFNSEGLFSRFLAEAIRGMGPAPAAPNQGDYTGPYDQMLQRLTQAVGSAGSAIDQQLPQMQANQAAIAAEGRQQFDQARANLAATNAGSERTLASAATQMREQQGGDQSAQALAAVQAAQASRTAGANDYAARMQTQGDEALRGRQALADGLIQAARATLQANNVAGQNQIDLGRTNAMRAYQSDLSRHEAALRQREAQAQSYAQSRVDRLRSVYDRDRSNINAWNQEMQQAFTPVADPMESIRGRTDGYGRAVRDVVSRLENGEVTLGEALGRLRSEEGQAAVNTQYGSDVDSNMLASDIGRIYREARASSKERAAREALRGRPRPNVGIYDALRSIGV